MDDEPDIDRVIERKAATSGEYAIAYALLRLAYYLSHLGFFPPSPGHGPGTTEKMAMELGEIASVLRDGQRE